jgi:hypothetical protein
VVAFIQREGVIATARQEISKGIKINGSLATSVQRLAFHVGDKQTGPPRTGPELPDGWMAVCSCSRLLHTNVMYSRNVHFWRMKFNVCAYKIINCLRTLWQVCRTDSPVLRLMTGGSLCTELWRIIWKACDIRPIAAADVSIRNGTLEERAPPSWWRGHCYAVRTESLVYFRSCQSSDLINTYRHKRT